MEKLRVIFLLVKTNLNEASSSSRAVFAVALLGCLSIAPLLLTRIIQQNWTLAALNSVLLAVFSGIAINILKNQYLDLSRYILGALIILGITSTTIIGGTSSVYWLYPGFVGAFFIFRPKTAVILAFAVGIVIYPFLIDRLASADMLVLYATLMPTVIFIYFSSRELRKQHAQLTALVSQDYLTQTGNRRAFNAKAEICIKQLNKQGLHSVLILFDMDHFKRLNDTHGHVVGDAVLKDVTTLVSASLRSTDRLFRLGGEEFAIIVQNAMLKDAVAISEKIRESLSTHRNIDLPSYTVSFGLAALNKQETVNQWMERADKALYHSKQNGRDQVSVTP